MGYVELVGITEGVKGFAARIEPGTSITIGRSAACDVMLKRTTDDSSEVQADINRFKTISRCHIRVTVDEKGVVKLQDLSRNGTFIDGKRVSTVRFTPEHLSQTPPKVRLGVRESYILNWISD